MTPSPAPDRLTALIDRVDANVKRHDLFGSIELVAQIRVELAALRAEAASLQHELAEKCRESQTTARDLSDAWEEIRRLRRQLNEQEAPAASLQERLARAEQERDAWRWLHWGHPEASWACACGMINGSAIVQCIECEAWRPMKPAVLAEVQAGVPYDVELVRKHSPARSREILTRLREAKADPSALIEEGEFWRATTPEGNHAE